MINMTPLREEILRDLALHPKSTTSDVAKRIDGDYKTVWAHMKLLRAKGLVIAELSQETSHVSPLFTLDKDALREHFAVALAYALGE